MEILLLQIWLILSAACSVAAGIGFYVGSKENNDNAVIDTIKE